MKLYKFENFPGFTKPGVSKIYRLTSDWAENGANWTQRTSFAKWTAPGGDFPQAAVDSFAYDGKLNKAWFSYDVTNAVAAMVKDPKANFGFIIRVPDIYPGKTTSMNQENYFHSSEAADAALTPRLIVTGSSETKAVAAPPIRRSIRIQCSRGGISLCFDKQTRYSVAVTDYRGRTLVGKRFEGKADRARIPYRFTPGLYCITVQSEGASMTWKKVLF